MTAIKDILGTLVGLGEIATIVFLYFLPTFIAHQRKMPNLGGIFLVNLLTAWLCGIGWVIALVMACGQRQVRA